MESNQDLNDFTGLAQITETDLDELMSLVASPSIIDTMTASSEVDEANCISQTENSNVLNFNREKFPSQISFSNENNKSFFNSDYLEHSETKNLKLPLTQIEPNNSNSSSLLIDTQNITEIIVDEATQMPSTLQKHKQLVQIDNDNILMFTNKEIKEELLDLSTIVDSTEHNDSFAIEFEKFAADNFDIDLEELEALEKMNSNSRKNVSTLPRTQFDACKKLQNIITSCPLPAPTATHATESAQLEQYNALNYVTTNYSDIAISSIHATSNTSPCNRQQQANVHVPQSSAENSQFQTVNTHASASTIENSEANLQHISSLSGMLFPYNAAVDATMIPVSVMQLHDVIKAEYSDFAFVYALSAQLCQDRVPMDCFVNLKIPLLLSLASIGPNPDRPPIPIVAISNDTAITNYLMTTIGQLSARFIGPTDDIKPASCSSTYKWIEADSIILAQGGVFYIGDWSRLKVARADKIFKFIECSRVSIDKTPVVYSLQTAIWTHWRAFKHNARDQQTFNKFVKIFGIPIYVDDDNHEVLVDYMLQQTSVNTYESTVDNLSISTEDMRNFLSIVSKRTVDLTPEAATLLQKYFVASRTERPDCLTKQAFVILKQFSESFAKLAFRHEVLPVDVVAAIYISEHFIFNVYGASQNPPPPFKCYNFIGAVDEHLSKFNQWLDVYITKHYDKP